MGREKLDVHDLWSRCLKQLEAELTADELGMWLKPLQASLQDDALLLFAPNQFVLNRIQEDYLSTVNAIVNAVAGQSVEVRLAVGSNVAATARSAPKRPEKRTTLDPRYRFDNFVQGKSNQLARAAAMQVAENPGAAYNPLLLYGGTGLGKTHLLHATGNHILDNKPDARVLYLHSEQFVSEMINALRHNTIDDFKKKYRSVEALLIDDIQFFAGKERSQEEFFHTFNTLLEDQQQIVLTCDRYPKEVDGIETRLQSRFGWGLNTAIEPPDFETRAAIILNKAASMNLMMDESVAAFIARRVRTNVRDLEGALNTLFATARFEGRDAVSVDFAKEALRDLLSVHERQVTIANIQKAVADFYEIRVSDLLSKRRNRSIARPRQVAMSLAKELTDHSLPEIGDAFGGRDHTTVLHACKKIVELCEADSRIRDDRAKLLRILTA